MTKRNITICTLGAFLALGLIFWYGSLRTANTARTQPLTADLQYPIPPKPQPSTLPSASSIFTSERLGIRFNYLSYDQDFNESFSAEEKGNEITISFNSRPAEQSRTHFIIVLQKSATESLRQALEQIAFGGTTSNECVIAAPQFINIRPGYQALAITSVANVTDETENTCKSEYSSDWRSAYFLYNPDFPTKMLFIDNGQDPFPAGPEVNEQRRPAAETIEIFR